MLCSWLRALSKARQEHGDDWKSLPVEDEQFFTVVVSGSSYAAELGRVLIASHVDFLFSLDDNWTTQNVLPLFDLALNLKRGLQAWHGFLYWGRWNNRLLVYLLMHYEGAFPFLHSDFGKLRESFCNHLAGIAAWSTIGPLAQGWLNRFLLAVTEDERVMWASLFERTLQGIEEQTKATIWKSWLEEYWRNRLNGIPVPLTEREGEQMAEWSAHLEPVFPEAVEYALLTPVPDLKNSFLHTDLSESRD